MKQTALSQVLSCALLLFCGSQASAASCEDLSTFQAPGVTVVATHALSPGASELPESARVLELPEHCRVSALLRPAADSEIEMALWLPENWNGRYLALGNGGWAGSISYEAMARGLQGGYAVASNDTGHKGGSAAFVLDAPDRLVDFGHRAMHVMTLAAKAMIEQHYAAAPSRSYFQGCSTGGRQGLMEAQRYPQDYDAIIAGAPVNNMFALSAMQMHSHTSILRDRSLYLPEDKVRLLHEAVLSACEHEDGVRDGFLSDPQACDFDPAALLCSDGSDAQSCLSPGQVESARAAYAPLLTSDGKPVYPGHARGFELAWRMPAADASPPTLQSDAFQYVVHRSPEWDWQSFDLDSDFPLAVAAAGEVHAVDPDLSEFKARGGKLLIYHGWNDPGPSPLNTLDYLHAVEEAMGGRQDDWLRVFMMPGMEHCRGGVGPDQADFLGAMQAWLEQDNPPESITAARLREGVVDMTRPLCPFPAVASWTQRGNPDDAANYECRER